MTKKDKRGFDGKPDTGFDATPDNESDTTPERGFDATPERGSVRIEVEDDSSAQIDDEQARIEAAIRAGEEAAEAELASEAAAKANESLARIEELEAELDKAREEASTAVDRLARLQADWENYRRRTQAERETERARANERLVESILPVIDDLERAVAHAIGAEGDVAGQLASGVDAVRSKLVDVMSKHGVKQITPAGEAFDPLRHQAVGRVENTSIPEETVVDVYQLGYEMAGKVIRPAMVTVSYGGPARTAADADAAAGSGAASGAEPNSGTAHDTPEQGGDEEDGR